MRASLGQKQARQVLLEHRHKTDALFGLAVGVDDGLFDECVESPFPQGWSPSDVVVASAGVTSVTRRSIAERRLPILSV